VNRSPVAVRSSHGWASEQPGSTRQGDWALHGSVTGKRPEDRYSGVVWSTALPMIDRTYGSPAVGWSGATSRRPFRIV
jgi:hypothetical protein